MKDVKSYIRHIPGFPKEGIIFKDITTLLQDKDGFKLAVDMLAKEFSSKNIDAVLSIEARGFIFGGAVAYKLGTGLVPVRKKGKLPYKTFSISYSLEYGTDTLEIHQDAFKKGANILIVDDLLATGGTSRAVVDLVEKMGGKIVGLAFVSELLPLKGRDKLKGYEVLSLVKDEYC